MRKKIIAVSIALMSLCGIANADVVQTLTINGQKVEKVVSQLTFSGDNVVLHFADSEESYALEDVVIDFSGTTSIDKVSAFKLNGFVDGNLDISGLSAGTVVSIFDVSGKKLASVKTSSGSAHIDLGGLNAGVYILKAGNQIVKFVKR